jgi:hypothetical protein
MTLYSTWPNAFPLHLSSKNATQKMISSHNTTPTMHYCARQDVGKNHLLPQYKSPLRTPLSTPFYSLTSHYTTSLDKNYYIAFGLPPLP